MKSSCSKTSEIDDSSDSARYEFSTDFFISLSLSRTHTHTHTHALNVSPSLNSFWSGGKGCKRMKLSNYFLNGAKKRALKFSAFCFQVEYFLRKLLFADRTTMLRLPEMTIVVVVDNVVVVAEAFPDLRPRSLLRADEGRLEARVRGRG